MPKVDIPINLGANLAYDEVGLETHGAALLDGYTRTLSGKSIDDQEKNFWLILAQAQGLTVYIYGISKGR